MFCDSNLDWSNGSNAQNQTHDAQPVLVQVSKFENPQDACAAIVAESYRLWLQYETRTDDITIIIVHIDGFEEVSTCKRRLE
jgi:hypothetical protein